MWRSGNSVANLNCSRGRIYAKGAAAAAWRFVENEKTGETIATVPH